MVFLIIVGVWGGFAGLHDVGRYAAAIAFAVLDFVINAFMIVWTLLGRGRSQGGGFAPPPTVTTAP